MRFLFKTDYNTDIKLMQHSGHWWSYGLLLAAVAAVPFLFGNYVQSQFVFVMIYAIVGVALMILTGFTGQASLGHAAFLAIGAYTAGFLQAKGFDFLIYFPLAGIVAGLIGVIVGFPALRLHGLYLLIATISFGFIVEEILARWESVTHGNEGMQIKALQIFGTRVPRDSAGFYFLCLGTLIASIVMTLNLLRSPTGRAFMAVRDSETAAKSMGVNLATTKVKAFGLSAALTGLAGALFAHKMSFISPEMFTLLLSIEFIMIIIIGGVIGLHGAILGAIFVVMVDPLLTLLKDDAPHWIASLTRLLGFGADAAARAQATAAAIGGAAGLKGAIYGVLIMLFIIYEPYGLYGRWLKIKLYFQTFPLYKAATFKRQKTYVKTERNR